MTTFIDTMSEHHLAKAKQKQESCNRLSIYWVTVAVAS